MRIVIPRLPPSLNKILRMHWAQVQRVFNEWAHDVFWAYFAETTPGERYPCNRVIITFYVKDNRRRDLDNLIGGGKGILDGLRKAGAIRDDSWQNCEVAWRIKKGDKELTEILLV